MCDLAMSLRQDTLEELTTLTSGQASKVWFSEALKKRDSLLKTKQWFCSTANSVRDEPPTCGRTWEASIAISTWKTTLSSFSQTCSFSKADFPSFTWSTPTFAMERTCPKAKKSTEMQIGQELECKLRRSSLKRSDLITKIITNFIFAHCIHFHLLSTFLLRVLKPCLIRVFLGFLFALFTLSMQFFCFAFF